jgi:uridine kinase
VPALVIVLAGPSGSGKSRLARRLGLPVLALDDFYRDGDDPGLPRVELSDGESIVDWDDPGSWDRQRALDAIDRLCHEGCAEVPVYDIRTSRVTGHRVLTLGERCYVVAEGIFAAEVVADVRERGLLAAAVCVQHHRLVTYALRLLRDLREHRKAPHVLVRRGWRLMRTEPEIVARMAERGCEPMSPRRAEQRLRDLIGT